MTAFFALVCPGIKIDDGLWGEGLPPLGEEVPGPFEPAAAVLARGEIVGCQFSQAPPPIPPDENDLSPTVALLFNPFAPPKPKPTIPSSFDPFSGPAAGALLSLPILLNPRLVFGLTGLGKDNFSSAIESVDSVDVGLTGGRCGSACRTVRPYQGFP